MDPVVHFEMPVDDGKRVSEFYSKVFGWQMNQLGPEMGNYLLATTSPMDENSMHKNKGAINGGFFTKSKENQHPSIVIAVQDIQKAMKDVEATGGKVVGASKGKEPDNIPGIGLYISIEDTEGNRVGMLQPTAM